MKSTSTLYIDESGKSSLAKEENEPFILTGVILDNKESKTTEGFFTYIKRKFDIDLQKPFHSYHIYENPRTKLGNEHLLQLSNTLSEFISLIPIKIKIFEINKGLFKKALGIKSNMDFKGDRKRKELKDYPYRVMASGLFIWFENYLVKNDYIGQVIVDSRRGGDHQLLKTLNLCKEGHIPDIDKITSHRITERITAVCFSEKNFLSGGLEITDLVSYTTFIRVRRLLTQHKSIGLDLLWKEINKKSKLVKIDGARVKRFFGIKKGEVHKYLKG